MYIAGYNCTTAAGFGVKNLMNSLYSGIDTSVQAKPDGGRVCFLNDRNLDSNSFQEKIVHEMTRQWTQLKSELSADLAEPLKSSKIAFVFASTKGCIEDFIWNKNTALLRETDPYTPIINQFVQTNGDHDWQLNCTISNACSSTAVAIEYAQQLFEAERYDYVLLAAADLVGPFVYNGFDCLRVLSHTKNISFGAGRDGLQLGEAVCLILLSRNKAKSAIEIKNVASHTEGALITRPSLDGAGLLKALLKTDGSTADLVIAHGTGTVFNDYAEDAALEKFMENKSVPIVGTKWCIGHSLGASGAIDLIAGCEVLKQQKIFRFHNTDNLDPKLKMNYLNNASTDKFNPIKKILITSLGFGGIHAALTLTKAAE